VALGGTAYAAFRLPKNSVGTKQLKNGAVTTKKLARGAVTAAKLNVKGVTVPRALRADSATNATTAANATDLGGSPASAFEPAGSILTAVVSDLGGSVAVQRGTPGVTAVSAGAGTVNVTLPRDISACTWIATQGNPGSNVVPGDYAAVRGVPQNNHVIEVVTFDHNGLQVDANFHLAVIC
jgi:hypothetical protein